MGFEVNGASSYDEADKRIANNILNYLLTHRESKDTLEGISQWWLKKEYIEATVDMVARGLSLLCAQGLVVEEKGGGTSGTFVINALEKALKDGGKGLLEEDKKLAEKAWKSLEG